MKIFRSCEIASLSGLLLASMLPAADSAFAPIGNLTLGDAAATVRGVVVPADCGGGFGDVRDTVPKTRQIPNTMYTLEPTPDNGTEIAVLSGAW